MEVRRIVIVEVHRDRDAEEAGEIVGTQNILAGASVGRRVAPKPSPFRGLGFAPRCVAAVETAGKKTKPSIAGRRPASGDLEPQQLAVERGQAVSAL